MPQELAQTALLRVASDHGLGRLARSLSDLPPGAVRDLVGIESALRGALDDNGTRAADSARHLLEAGGKRVRPMMALLAARLFQPDGDVPALATMAQVAELIHSATLLHDDVIDLGERRRGRPASRVVFGNAAAVLGGDLLLVRSVDEVAASAVPSLLPVLLRVLWEMISAESLQLEKRGRLDLSEDEYFEITRGKTGSLFRWCTESGGRAAGAPEGAWPLLQTLGYDLGIGFQLVDDLLDFADEASTGKSVLQDLRNGTITLPVILAQRESPAAVQALADLEKDPEGAGAALFAAVQDSGALHETRARIDEYTERAHAQLSRLPESWSREVLAAFVDALAERGR